MFSLMIYLLTFLITIILTFLAELILKGDDINGNVKISNNKSRLGALLLISVAVILLSMIASLRAVTVGTDVTGYIINNFSDAQNSSNFFNFYNSQIISTNGMYLSKLSEVMEPLFALILFIGAKAGSIGITFFIIEFLIVTPIYIFLYLNRKSGSMVIGITLFLFLFYNFSLSGMRQSIAMSLFLLATYFLLNGSPWKAIILLVFAYFFHTSIAIVSVILFLVYFIFNKKQNNKKQILIITTLLLILLLLLYSRLSSFLIDISSKINPRYGYYISHYAGIYNQLTLSNIPISELVFKSLIVIYLSYIVIKSKRVLIIKNQILLFLQFIGIYLILFNANFYESLRLAYYFNFLMIYSVPITSKCINQDRINILLNYLFCCFPAVLYWAIFIMYRGAYGTVPYLFR